jgi:hypothetical protein
MKAFDILLFAPHLPAHGQETRARFTSTHLVVDHHPIDIPLTEVGVTLGGFDHKQLYLFWHEEEGRWAISPRNPVAREALIRSAPTPLDVLLRHAARDIRRHGRPFILKHVPLAVALVLILLLVGILFWRSDWIARWVSHPIRTSKEAQLGEQTSMQATPKMGLRKNDGDWLAAYSTGPDLPGRANDVYQGSVEERIPYQGAPCSWHLCRAKAGLFQAVGAAGRWQACRHEGYNESKHALRYKT